MRTVLRNKKGRYTIDIPSTIVGLYDLKDGQVFEVKIKDNDNGVLLISMATKLLDE